MGVVGCQGLGRINRDKDIFKSSLKFSGRFKKSKRFNGNWGINYKMSFLKPKTPDPLYFNCVFNIWDKLRILQIYNTDNFYFKFA